jgi:hypothetical protein
MRRVLSLAGLLRRGLALAAVGALGLTTAIAQPAPPQDAAIPEAPPEETAPPPGPPTPEEAPPAIVPTPPPVYIPPLDAKEVAPAAPPKAQVVEKASETTAKRVRQDIAVLQAIDKITAETLRFKAEVGKPVRYKNLVFTVKACERSAADEPFDDSIVYLTIHSQPRAAPGKPAPPARQAFRGWMYASSPGLHPLEHPIYDAWLITCTTAAPAPGTAPAPAPAAPPKPAAKPAPKPASKPAPEPAPAAAPVAPEPKA